MDLETLTKSFDEYHATAKKTADHVTMLERRLDAEKKYREDLETKMNRLNFTGGGFATGEDLRDRELKSAFGNYLRRGDDAELKSMSVGSDPDGGYSVVTPLASTIIKRIFEVSPMRRLARNVNTSSDAYEELDDATEAEANWVGETAARPTTDTPKLGKIRIAVHEIYANPAATQQIIDDSSVDIGAWLVEKVANRFARREAAAFVVGNGVGQPRGLLTYPTAATADGSRAWGTIQHVPSGAASTLATTNAADALVDVMMALKSEYRAGASWMMNRKTAGTIMKLKDGQGNYLWQQSVILGQPSLLLGHPVEFAEDMPDIGADKYPIAFGDFASAYTVVNRFNGISVLRDPYSSKPYVLFYTRHRVGGGLHNSEAVKLLKIATS